MNSLLKRLERNDHGRKSEKKNAKKFSARLRPGSGAMPGAKGDFILPDFLFEAKSTINASISLKFDWLKKIAQEALDLNREPALTITFVDHQGTPHHRGDWVLIRASTLREIINEKAVQSRPEKDQSGTGQGPAP